MKTLLVMHILALLLPAAALAAPGLDVNDVSFLLPVRERVSVPTITLSDEVSLIPASVFRQVLTFEHPGTPIDELPYVDSEYLADLSRWMVTSVRFDHCGDVFHLEAISPGLEQASQAEGCQPRLRLVVQPLSYSGTPLPTALHLLYGLDAEKSRALVDALFSIRDAGEGITRGKPLGIHPALDSQEFDGPVATKLRQAVVAGVGKLEIVTLIVQDHVNQWKMTGGTIRGGRWTRFVTESSRRLHEPGSARAGIEELDCTTHGTCAAKPETLFAGFLADNPQSRERQVPRFRTQAMYELAEEIDRPARRGFFNTDCVSCHESSNFRDRAKLHGQPGLPEGITPFVSKSKLSLVPSNVINFGYLGGNPRVSTRTSAESSVVADAINRERGLKNPGREFPSFAALEDFWKCLVSSDLSVNCLN